MSSTPPVSKFRAALESAYRTFLQAALPAFGAAVVLSRPEGLSLKDFVVAAFVAAGSAGIAAVARVWAPLSTDTPGVGVE